MPLPQHNVERIRMHQRRISFDGFKRNDGLWDIEARLVDTKDQDFNLSSGMRRRGEAIHEIGVRVTIDNTMTVIGVASSADATPFKGSCERILPDYSKIIGLNLFDGFLKTVKEMFGGTRGCTHVSELLMSLPTAALQTFTSEGNITDSDQRPFQLDRCHALSSNSDVVLRYYPRWYRDQNPG